MCPWCGNQLGGGMMGGTYGLSWIFSLVFFVLIIVGVVLLIGWLVQQSSGRGEKKAPLDILKERYVKGEISKEEFDKMKKDLGG